MTNREETRVDQYVGFAELFKRSDLEQALKPYKDTEQYAAIFRYYRGCIDAGDDQALLMPLGLLQEALASLVRPARRRRETDEPPPRNKIAELEDIHEAIKDYDTRVTQSVDVLKSTLPEVPRKLHFVWLGGGVGDIQRDYIQIWKQVMSGAGQELMLWYDSDALLAYETNRIIVEAAKADAMAAGAIDSPTFYELGDSYVERLRPLKEQLFTHIRQLQEQGVSADEARIDLLVRGYGQDETRLKALREKNLRSIKLLGEKGVQLRDLQALETPMRLQDVYEREVNLRGNFAGASDAVRIEVLYIEGGAYTDVDNLPPLVESLGGVDISKFTDYQRLGVLQLLLDHNPEWIPGRVALRERYKSQIDSIPEERLPALEAFAKKRPAMNEVFHVPEERAVQLDSLRAAGVSNSVNNSFLMAHPGSATLDAVINRILLNYEVVKTTERRIIEQNIPYSDAKKILELASTVGAEVFGSIKNQPHFEDITVEETAVGLVTEAVAGYYMDGIFPDSEVTIYITGPQALLGGVRDYEKSSLTPRSAEALGKFIAIKGARTVNRQTEEEMDHSWKEQADAAQWFIDEKERWQTGRYEVRYKGDVTQLLQRQTIEFDAGWPLIEGRHVLRVAILEQLVEGLGEPFRLAMSNGANGAVTFNKSLPLSFNDRQAILAQPAGVTVPGYVSDAATAQLPIVESLERIAKGALRIEQLSPAQRLGGLLGLDALDNPGFEAVRGEIESLAKTVSEQGTSGRYGTFERLLYKHNAPAFSAGLQAPVEETPGHFETALALKKTALEAPLTLRQWGQQVARIKQVATTEHRLQIGERVVPLREAFERDSSSEYLPQDLLAGGDGDVVGQRCYPLSIVMAAALVEGPAASYNLRDRFFTSVASPETHDSATFIQTIEELRGAQVNEIGIALQRSSLAQVVARLIASKTTCTLMLTTDNHAMLVAKTLRGSHSQYHFYDPNLGVFVFAQPQSFLRVMERFFQQREIVKYYAAYGSAKQPTFDLIELHADKVSSLTTSSGVRVSDLLLPGELRGQNPHAVGRHRTPSARGQSLVNNARLGRSLMELDSHWWAGQIQQATGDLLAGNQLSGEFSPVFETLEITPAGDYQISVVKPASSTDAEQWVRLNTRDSRFLRIKNHLTELFGKLTSPRVSELDPLSVGSVHTLNAGFAIQALMNALRAQEGDGKNLSLAVRLHAYVNYAQLVHGLVMDVAGVVQLVRQGLAQERLMAQTSSTVVGEALGHIGGEGVGTVLGMANVGFDIYQLSEAENDMQVARFGTQLAFDSASSVLGIAALGAGLASAAAAAAVLGGLSVIVGGLAVGVAALAEGFASIAEKAKEVGQFFAELDAAYRGDAFSWNEQRQAWLPHPKLVIQRLDFQDGRVTYDSQRLFPLRNHFGVPDYDVDFERAINLRQQLGLPGTSLFNPANAQVVMLPCTPQTFYGYEYQLLPFSTWRHDPGFDIARRLERKNAKGEWQFLFTFYSFPGEYILKAINPAYRPGTPSVIQVRLDNTPRVLVVQELPASWHGRIAYEIEGGEAPCTLLLNPGVSLELKAAGTRTMQWVLLASWAKESDVQFVRGEGLKIGAVSLTFGGKARLDVTLQLGDNNRYRVDFLHQQLIDLEQEATPGMEAEALRGHFMVLAREHRLELPYTPVHQFPIPFEDPADPRHCTAYYDSAQERFLFIRDDDVIVPDDPLLGAVVEGSAYFYHPQSPEVWRVDAVTGLINHRYRLVLKVGGSTVTHCESVPGVGVRVVQQVAHENQVDVLEYLITDEGLFLTSLTRELDVALEQVLGQTPTLANWGQVFGAYIDWPNVASQERFETSVWQLASFVSIHWKPGAQLNDMAWVRRSDRLIIRPIPKLHHGRGWPDSQKAQNELGLLAPAGNEGDVFVIYQRQSPRLCVQRRSVVNGQLQLSVQWQTLEGLSNVVATQEGSVAITQDGVFYTFTPQGRLQLSGVTEVWFKDRPQWWAQLPALLAEEPGASLALVGLSNFSGDARLCAWCLDGHLLLADLGHGKEVRVLGITPDNAAAWLFDVASGEIYRQAFIEPLRLPTAFGTGTKVLLADALPEPQQPWSPWTFVDVSPEGAGLRATTDDGIEMLLNHQEAALIIGVDRRWVRARADGLSENLKALVDSYFRCAPLLSVAQPDRQQWYVSETGRLIDAANVRIPEPFSVVGTQRQTNVLLYQKADARLHTYPHTGMTGAVNYVQREGEVMVIEGRTTLDDLVPLIPDDVRTLVLRFGEAGATYRLSNAAWRRLESIIVDCRPPLNASAVVPGTLVWAMDTVDSLIVSLEGEHVVILDRDTFHSLVLREVNAADVTLRGELMLAVGKHEPVAVSTFVTTLRAMPPSTGVALLTLLQPVVHADLA